MLNPDYRQDREGYKGPGRSVRHQRGDIDKRRRMIQEEVQRCRARIEADRKRREQQS